MNQKARVVFSPEQSERIAELAEIRKKIALTRKGTRKMSATHDDVGVAGEAGLHIWLTERRIPFLPLWKDNLPGPDFEVEGVGSIDIKTQLGSDIAVLWNNEQYLKWRDRPNRERILLFAKARITFDLPPDQRFQGVDLLGWIEAAEFVRHPSARIRRAGEKLLNGRDTLWSCIELPARELRPMWELERMARTSPEARK